MAGQRREVLGEIAIFLKRAQRLKGFVCLIPEVGMNVAYSLPGAAWREGVAAVPGRIRDAMGVPAFLKPKFGASRHVASAVLEVIKRFPDNRCVVNVRYSPKALKACRRLGFKIAKFDRKMEPPEVKWKEGSSIYWGVGKAIDGRRVCPDVIYNLGEAGKEPMILLIGKNPEEVWKKVSDLFTEVMA